MNILFSLTTFTILWVVSASGLFFLLLKKLNEAQKLYLDAAEEYRKAAKERERTAKIYDQVCRSLNCPN